MTPFPFIHRPRDMGQAASLLAGGPALLMGGGTALRIEWNRVLPRGRVVIDLSGVEDARYVGIAPGWIGAGVPLATLEHDDRVPALLRQAIGNVASPAVRRLATLGGQIGGRSGCTLAALLVMEAWVQALLPGESTPVVQPLAQWLRDPPAGIVVGIGYPVLDMEGWQGFYRKVGLRQAFTPATAVVAGMVRRAEDGSIVDVRLAAGGKGLRPCRLNQAEALLRGDGEAEIRWPRWREGVATGLCPPGQDGRETAYIRTMIANLLAVFLGGRQGLPVSAVPDFRAPAPLPPLEGEKLVSRATMPDRWAVRSDMPGKVDTSFGYLTDRREDGMLVGRILRAGRPHARIRHIDVAAARALPGVHAVVTAADIPGLNGFGIVFQDQPALCDTKVRYTGDMVAAVAAEDAATAARALELIHVDYEDLPVVSDPVAALAHDAPGVHDNGNLCREIRFGYGDVEDAFRTCAHVLETTYETPRQMHAFMETEGGYAYVDAEGTLHVCIGSQHGTRDRMQLARILDWPAERIHIVSSPVGGAFGGKDELTVQPAAALLAIRSGRTVRMHLDRDESVQAGTKSPPMRIRMKTGCDAQGRIVAQDVDVIADCGAYASLAPCVLETGMEHVIGPYLAAHVRSRGRLVYTNNGTGGAFRGFGANQMTYAIECQMDRLARQVGLDPVEMRRRNLRGPEDRGYLGQMVAPSIYLNEMLDAAASSPLWRNPRLPSQGDDTHLRGVGMGLIYQGNGLGTKFEDPLACRLRLAEDGCIEAWCDLVEMGQGITAVVQSSMEQALGCAREDVRPVLGDTRINLDSGSTTASRGTIAANIAIRGAAGMLAERLVAQAAMVLDCPPAMLRPGRGGIHDVTRNADTQPLLTYTELARRAPDLSGLTVEFRGQVPTTLWKRANARYLFCTGVVICQVAVERATGVVTLEKAELHCAAGPVIDVAGYLGQLEGGLMQGMGFTLMEHVPYGAGRPLALNFDGYMVPMMPDTPQALAIHAYEAMDSNDPAGVRGVGELGMAALTPAMANAVAAATGMWPHAAPFRPEQIMRAIGTWIEEPRQ